MGVWGLDDEENQCADKDVCNNIGSFLHVSYSVCYLKVFMWFVD